MEFSPSKKKFLFIIFSDFPGEMAAAERRLCFAEGLKLHDVEVEFLVCKRTTVNSDTNIISEGVEFSFKFRYISGNLRSSNRYIANSLDVLDFFKSLLYIKRNFSNQTILYTYFQNVLYELLISIFALVFNYSIFRELCELPYVYGRQTVLKKIKRLFIFNVVFKLYSGFVVISQQLFTIASKYKKRSSKIIKIPIVVNPSRLLYSNSSILESNAIIKQRYILHSGSMVDSKDGISQIINAFALSIKRLSDDIKLVFVGRCSQVELNKYQIMCNSLEISNRVVFLGFVKKEDVSYIQSNAYLTIVNKPIGIQNNFNFPTKLGELIYHNVLIVASNYGEMSSYLIDNVNSLLFPPNDIFRMSECIIFGFQNSLKRVDLIKNAKQLALKEFSVEQNGLLLYTFFYN